MKVKLTENQKEIIDFIKKEKMFCDDKDIPCKLFNNFWLENDVNIKCNYIHSCLVFNVSYSMLPIFDAIIADDNNISFLIKTDNSEELSLKQFLKILDLINNEIIEPTRKERLLRLTKFRNRFQEFNNLFK